GYAPSPYAGRVTLFRALGTAGAKEPPERGAAAGTAGVAPPRPAGAAAGTAGAAASPADRTFGWAAYTPLPVEIEEGPGDHLSCLAEPHVAVLAARLRACLDRAGAAGQLASATQEGA